MYKRVNKIKRRKKTIIVGRFINPATKWNDFRVQRTNGIGTDRGIKSIPPANTNICTTRINNLIVPQNDPARKFYKANMIIQIDRLCSP